MPDRVEVNDVTCPASTPLSAPVEVALTAVVACQVRRLTLRVPAGHAGLTGIAFGYGHNAILPRTPNRYIASDNEVMVFDLADYPPGPQWQAFMVNLDVQAHTWQVRMEVDELTAGQAANPPAALTPTAIYASAGQLLGV